MREPEQRAIFENDTFRVIDVELGPKKTTPQVKSLNRIVYALSDGKLLYKAGEGAAVERDVKTGEAHWHNSDKHTVQNTGETPLHLVMFMFKK
ncbi:MAG: hypothetical protein KCHDKBKB_03084 [Elusimicrobia bacterium]|nr:hypothetical protein [Elusimicrobiota bacterium]